MLVLQRKLGESILIGRDIKVYVTEIKCGTAVKLGIEAPPDVEVWRTELLDGNRPRRPRPTA